MIVDTSAVLALLLDEPEADDVDTAMRSAVDLRMPAPTMSNSARSWPDADPPCGAWPPNSSTPTG